MEINPSEEELARLPSLFSCRDTPYNDRVAHLHFHTEVCDWYALEYNSERQLFFGYFVHRENPSAAKTDYFSLRVLNELQTDNGPVMFDQDWTPQRIEDISELCDKALKMSLST